MKEKELIAEIDRLKEVIDAHREIKNLKNAHGRFVEALISFAVDTEWETTFEVGLNKKEAELVRRYIYQLKKRTIS